MVVVAANIDMGATRWSVISAISPNESPAWSRPTVCNTFGFGREGSTGPAVSVAALDDIHSLLNRMAAAGRTQHHAKFTVVPSATF